MDKKELGMEIVIDKYVNENTGDTISIIAYIGQKGKGWAQTDDITIQKIYENGGECVYAEMLYRYSKEKIN